MRTAKRLLLALLLGSAALLTLSCATKEQDPSTSMPWGRPADWEGRIPGMGS